MLRIALGRGFVSVGIAEFVVSTGKLRFHKKENDQLVGKGISSSKNAQGTEGTIG